MIKIPLRFGKTCFGKLWRAFIKRENEICEDWDTPEPQLVMGALDTFTAGPDPKKVRPQKRTFNSRDKYYIGRIEYYISRRITKARRHYNLHANKIDRLEHV